MIKVKHFMDASEADDGLRVWVEPIGLTKDLQEMCSVNEIFSHIGPPPKLAKWFEKHTEGYEYFRGKYHAHLEGSAYRRGLVELAAAARHSNFTLLHGGDNPNENVATALHEYVSELQAYLPPEMA